MSKSKKPNDPFAKREAEKYSHPIPSREFILEHLEKIGEPAGHEQLCKQLELQAEEQIEALRRRLIAMSRDGQIISNRRGVYGLATHMDLKKGRVQGNKDGFGFFIPEDASGDLFLNAREMEKLFDGDKVLARHTDNDSRGRKEGSVIEILERRYTEIVGRYYQESGFGVVIPDSKRVSHEILIPEKNIGKAEDGQFVVAKITEYPSKRRKAIAEIVEVLGDTGTPGLEIDIAVRSHDIPHEFPSSVKKETARFSGEVLSEDLVGRKDLRNIPFVTIDGEDAKDFDDAVFAHQHGQGGWSLMVAIADVSHYVSIGSALDEEAINRGTSVYFPGHVIPMLPEKLSNGLCSLKPEVDRLTLVCEMKISSAGVMTDYCFYEAVIHSHGRMTYTEVADIVQTASNDTEKNLQVKLRERHSSLVEHLDNLYALYHALRNNRESGGAMEFDSTETRMVFGENKKIREIVPAHRNDAHKLIEECMLAANVATAQLLEESKLPALFRNHEGPNPNKLDNLREFLKEMDLYLGGGEDPEPVDFQNLLQKLTDRPDRHLLQTMIIRSLMQAVYQPVNLGHFGLGFPAYAHFTSPIRRYPDLLVHRAIRYLIRNKTGKHLEKQADAVAFPKNKSYPYSMTEMEQLGVNCSTAERRADAASYSVIDWLKCEYMQDKIGEDFAGTVSSVTSFGLFVELTEIFVEGLVHISELSNDYYHFDPVRHCLEGERSNKIYRLGDAVEVKVARVDLDEKKIDLQMVGQEASRPRKKPASKSLRDKLRKGEVPDKKASDSKYKSKSGGKPGGKPAGKSGGKSGKKSGKKPKPGSKSRPGKNARNANNAKPKSTAKKKHSARTGLKNKNRNKKPDNKR